MKRATQEAFRMVQEIFQQYHPDGDRKDAVDAFGEFTNEWRPARRKALEAIGRKMPGIYSKDKDTGEISVVEDALLTQYRQFESSRMKQLSEDQLRRNRTALAEDMQQHVLSDQDAGDDWQKG